MTDDDTRRQLANARYAARVAAVLLRHTARDVELGRTIDPAALRSAADDLSAIGGRDGEGPDRGDTRYCFLVLRTDEPDPERQGLRSGTTAAPPDTASDSLAIAETIAQETRLARDYWGPMTVGIWLADGDPTPGEALRDGEMPASATTHTFGEVTHRRRDDR